jgi:hypothetical protein
MQYRLCFIGGVKKLRLVRIATVYAVPTMEPTGKLPALAGGLVGFYCVAPQIYGGLVLVFVAHGASLPFA